MDFPQLVAETYTEYLNTTHKNILNHIFGLGELGIGLNYLLDSKNRIVCENSDRKHSITPDKLIDYVKSEIIRKTKSGTNYVFIPINFISRYDDLSMTIENNMKLTCQYVSNYLSDNLGGLKLTTEFKLYQSASMWGYQSIKITWILA